LRTLEHVGRILLDRWADDRTDGQHTKNWNAYLQVAFRSEPIGRRYAGALVLRLKFELGIVFAMISAGLGLIWLAILGLPCSVLICCGLLCLLFSAWGLLEARDTHKVLSKTRAALLSTIHVVEQLPCGNLGEGSEV
jgi:hypothetical protein